MHRPLLMIVALVAAMVAWSAPAEAAIQVPQDRLAGVFCGLEGGDHAPLLAHGASLDHLSPLRSHCDMQAGHGDALSSCCCVSAHEQAPPATASSGGGGMIAVTSHRPAAVPQVSFTIHRADPGLSRSFSESPGTPPPIS